MSPAGQRKTVGDGGNTLRHMWSFESARYVPALKKACNATRLSSVTCFIHVPTMRCSDGASTHGSIPSRSCARPIRALIESRFLGASLDASISPHAAALLFLISCTLFNRNHKGSTLSSNGYPINIHCQRVSARSRLSWAGYSSLDATSACQLHP